MRGKVSLGQSVFVFGFAKFAPMGCHVWRDVSQLHHHAAIPGWCIAETITTI